MTLALRERVEGIRASVGTEMDEPASGAGTAYVSTAQVAAALGVGLTPVKRGVAGGVFPAHKTAGGHRRLLLRDVLRIVREGDFPRLDLGRLRPPSAERGSPDAKALSAAVLAALKRGDGG